MSCTKWNPTGQPSTNDTLLFYPKQMKYSLQYDLSPHKQTSKTSEWEMWWLVWWFSHHKHYAWLGDGVRKISRIRMPSPHNACHTLALDVSGVPWSLRCITIVSAPRLTWHSRNRILTNPCHLILPTGFPRISLYPHNLTLWGGFRSGRKDQLGHSPSLLPALRWGTWPLCAPNIWGCKPVAG